MKAILVIDMPSNCLDCPCEYDDGFYTGFNACLDEITGETNG